MPKKNAKQEKEQEKDKREEDKREDQAVEIAFPVEQTASFKTKAKFRQLRKDLANKRAGK